VDGRSGSPKKREEAQDGKHRERGEQRPEGKSERGARPEQADRSESEGKERVEAGRWIPEEGRPGRPDGYQKEGRKQDL